jgi:hypothetical protein
MPTFILGLPLHVLVVHAVVVLLPMAVLGAILVTVVPRLRERWGWPAVALAIVATACIPVATSSGEGLEHRLPRTPGLETHAHLGDELLPFAAIMTIALLGLMLIERARRRSPAATETAGAEAGPARAGMVTASRTSLLTGRAVGIALACIVIGSAVVSAAQVVRIGDSGARAAWGDTQYVQPSPGPGADD